MGVQAGKLRHRITVQQATDTQSASGRIAQTWSTYATRWAERLTEGGSERYVGTEEDAKRVVRWRVRFDATTDAITPAMRVSADSRTYDISAAYDPTGRREEIVIESLEDV